MTLSNGRPCQLRGSFHTINADLGLLGLNGGASLSFTDAGVWQLTIQFPGLLPSWGLGAHETSMNTFTAVQPF